MIWISNQVDIIIYISNLVRYNDLHYTPLTLSSKEVWWSSILFWVVLSACVLCREWSTHQSPVREFKWESEAILFLLEYKPHFECWIVFVLFSVQWRVYKLPSNFISDPSDCGRTFDPTKPLNPDQVGDNCLCIAGSDKRERQYNSLPIQYIGLYSLSQLIVVSANSGLAHATIQMICRLIKSQTKYLTGRDSARNIS